MKTFFTFFVRVLPFTVGVILILTSLAFLADFTNQSLDFGDLENEEFWAFVFFSMLGIPTLLFGINKASNENL
jgi:hypothetical protein